jgi:hypothetical protein
MNIIIVHLKRSGATLPQTQVFSVNIFILIMNIQVIIVNLILNVLYMEFFKKVLLCILIKDDLKVVLNALN